MPIDAAITIVRAGKARSAAQGRSTGGRNYVKRPRQLTRPYCAAKLLEHGPLPYRELVEITGWKPHDAWHALRRLEARGVVACDGETWRLQ
jgi:predicted Rossmann fold nucleotide-binding protein DprA/Smf involved in DNA uptake